MKWSEYYKIVLESSRFNMKIAESDPYDPMPEEIIKSSEDVERLTKRCLELEGCLKEIISHAKMDREDADPHPLNLRNIARDALEKEVDE